MNAFFPLDLDALIASKLKEIESIKSDVETLRTKQNQCNEKMTNLKKRTASCTNAINELPMSEGITNDGIKPHSIQKLHHQKSKNFDFQIGC